jgi:hypothetical protein
MEQQLQPARSPVFETRSNRARNSCRIARYLPTVCHIFRKMPYWPLLLDSFRLIHARCSGQFQGSWAFHGANQSGTLFLSVLTWNCKAGGGTFEGFDLHPWPKGRATARPWSRKGGLWEAILDGAQRRREGGGNG